MAGTSPHLTPFLAGLLAVGAACAPPAPAEPASEPLAPAPTAPSASSPTPAAAPPVTSASAAAPAPAPTPATFPETGDLPERHRKALQAIATDPPPEKITLGRHYVVSNEAKPQLWQPMVEGRGGLVMGVGTEQNLLIAGWARASVLVLMDFDQWVVDTNKIHGVILRHAATPEEYVKLWGKESAAKVRGWVKEAYPDDASVLTPFRVGRNTVYRRLYMLQRLFKARKAPSYLSDQAMFEFVKGLFAEGRVRSVRGDLTGNRTMKSIASFAKEHDVPVRVVYLSNAQDYFTYDRGAFRDNVTALPVDDESVVLHTIPIDGRKYNYVAQPAQNFQAWLASGKVKSFRELFRHATRAPGKEPVFRIEKAP